MFEDLLEDCTISTEYSVQTEHGLHFDDEYQSEEEEFDSSEQISGILLMNS